MESALQAAGVWASRQGAYKRALARGGAGAAGVLHWQSMLAQCARIERMSKGRERGDAWLQLERLLLGVAVRSALRLLAR